MGLATAVPPRPVPAPPGRWNRRGREPSAGGAPCPCLLESLAPGRSGQAYLEVGLAPEPVGETRARRRLAQGATSLSGDGWGLTTDAMSYTVVSRFRLGRGPLRVSRRADERVQNKSRRRCQPGEVEENEILDR
jgi:hypothetical protein